MTRAGQEELTNTEHVLRLAGFHLFTHRLHLLLSLLTHALDPSITDIFPTDQQGKLHVPDSAIPDKIN